MQKKSQKYRFCTAISCMDGRIQLPVIKHLQKRFNSDFVDMITEPGPNRILHENHPPELIDSILNRIQISVTKHLSTGIAIVGHFDCTGNPAPKETQTKQIKDAISFIRKELPNYKNDIIGLWVNKSWQVEEITFL